MKTVLAAWEQVYGLLVEDGQIAIGTLVAFALAAAWSAFGGEDVREQGVHDVPFVDEPGLLHDPA